MDLLVKVLDGACLNLQITFQLLILLHQIGKLVPQGVAFVPKLVILFSIRILLPAEQIVLMSKLVILLTLESHLFLQVLIGRSKALQLGLESFNLLHIASHFFNNSSLALDLSLCFFKLSICAFSLILKTLLEIILSFL